MRDTPSNAHLEPRVARLETGLESLARSVTDLSTAVRDNNRNVEDKLEKLTIAVTNAQAPQKTDWSTIIAGIMLVLAIGSAVFWPLNQTTQESKQSIAGIEQRMDDHNKLLLHPVGQALVSRLEEQIKDNASHSEREISLMKDYFKEQMSAIQAKNDLHNDRIYGRVIKLEEQHQMDNEREKDELQMWRQKAMGLNPTTTQTHSHLNLIAPSGQTTK